MVVDNLRLLRRRAGAPAGRDDPGGRRGRHDLPGAARRGRADRALELPADRSPPGSSRPALAAGNTVVLEAGRADAADRAASSRSWRSRPGIPEGVLNVRRRARAGWCGQRLVEHPRRRQDRLHRLDRGRAAASCAGAAETDQAGHPGAGRQVGQHRLRRRRPRERPRPPRPGAVFGNAGQDCCARSRILVERSALDELPGGCWSRRSTGLPGRRPARRGDRRWAR